MIDSKYQAKLSKQSYTNKPAIAGVRLIPLKLHSDETGSFTELVKFGKTKNLKFPDYSEFNLRQVNYSTLDPHSIKAFHLHLQQNEFWFVPPTDKLLMGLIDTRSDSPTKNNTLRLTLGGHQAKLIYIPAGVAHGVKNFQPTPAQIIYFVDTEFSLENNDENRLPWDILGADFWQKDRE